MNGFFTPLGLIFDFMNHTRRRHGFRFSFLDALILAAGAALTLWLRSSDFPLWWIVAMAVGHFFLFCNVFLVWQRWELLWAAVFVVNAGFHVVTGSFDWLPPFLWQLPWTVAVIGLQIRSPWYHGIFAERWNPRLQNYLNETP